MNRPKISGSTARPQERTAGKSVHIPETELRDSALRLMLFAGNHSVDELLQEALDELERITGSQIGFFHFVDPNQTSLTLQNWSTSTKRLFCKAEGKGSHYSIDKAGVWVDCVHQRKPVIHNDYESLPHKKGLPPGHAAVIRELVVPVIRADKVVSILGIGNKPDNYDEQDVRTVSLFAELVWDIVDRRRAEESLRASEDKYRMLVETTGTGFLILDSQGKVVDANQEYVRLSGHADLSEIMGRSVVEWTAEHEKQRNAEAVIRCVRDGKIRNLVIEYVDSKGRLTPVEINATVHGEGESLRIVSLCRDITERKKAEGELERNRHDLQQAQGIGKIGHFSYDPVSGRVEGSTELLRIFDVTPSQPVFKAFAEAIHPEDGHLIIPYIEKVVKEGVPYDVEHRVRHGNGTVLYVQAKGRIIVTPEGRRVVGTVQDITERKRIEKELRESEERYRAIFESSTDAIMTLEPPSWRFTSGNPAAVRMFGVTDEAHFTSMEPWMLSPGRQPDGRLSADKAQEMIELAMRDGSNSFEWRHKRFSGGEFPATVLLTRMEHLGKQFLQATVRDITERKRAEDAVLQVVKRLTQAQRVGHIGSFVYTIDTNHVEWSDEMYEIFGVSPADGPLSYERVLQSIHPDDRELHQEQTRRIAEDGYAEFEHRVVRPDGTVRLIHGAAQMEPASGEHPACMVGFIQDITERRKAETVLKESQQRLALAASSAQLGIWDWDIENDRMTWDDRMFRLYGVAQKPASYGVDIWSKGLHPDDAARAWDACRAALNGEKAYDPEFRVIHPDGTVRHIKANGLVLRNESGKPIRMIGVNYDITEKKQAEERERDLREKLERAARMESLGILAGGVAHDLNNILGPLVVLPDMVAEYVAAHADAADPDHQDVMDALKVLKTSALRATGVVSDLVVMGRRGQFQRAPVDLNLVVTQMVESKAIRALQARRPDVHLAVSLDPDPAWCMGSESRLARVLLNLTANAAEAIEGQGDVTVRTGRRRLAEPLNGYEQVPAGDYVTLEVADTGCGMDAKTMARIFEPFFSTKAPAERSGSGLGLSVVHGLLKDHAGYIDLKSAPGKGATFTVYLPAADAGVVQEAAKNTAFPGGSEQVLVVDDEPGQQYLSRRALSKLGYAVKVVASGEEAVALFDAAKREGRPAPFDMVMVDMIMKGMNGMTTCKALRALYPTQRLLIVSGHAPGDQEEETKALGIGWLSKPYTAADLAQAVRRTLGR